MTQLESLDKDHPLKLAMYNLGLIFEAVNKNVVKAEYLSLTENDISNGTCLGVVEYSSKGPFDILHEAHFLCSTAEGSPKYSVIVDFKNEKCDEHFLEYLKTIFEFLSLESVGKSLNRHVQYMFLDHNTDGNKKWSVGLLDKKSAFYKHLNKS